jgi:hypothetical protein
MFMRSSPPIRLWISAVSVVLLGSGLSVAAAQDANLPEINAPETVEQQVPPQRAPMQHGPRTGPLNAQQHFQQARTAPAAGASSTRIVIPAQIQAPSLLQEPPRLATVKLADGQLSVDADNASLTQILQSVATDSGMKIDGLGADQRIFGTYGPGNPHEVLQSLLDGSGYNVMMVGSGSNGAPRELVLSPRSASTPDAGQQQAAPPQQQPGDDDDDSADQDVDTGPAIQPAPIQRPGFNRPINVPPPNGEQTPPTPDQAPRTPQQMLEQLQQIRQQQMIQQQQIQQDPNSPN